jgi:hypothetical protein
MAGVRKKEGVVPGEIRHGALTADATVIVDAVANKY